MLRATRNPFNIAQKMFSSRSLVTPIVELREYELIPSKVIEYIQETTISSDVRKSLLPLRIFTMPETGGNINIATHFYYYEGGFSQRNEKRKRMGSNEDWKAYLQVARPCMVSQKSSIFVEAPIVKEFSQLSGLKAETPDQRETNSECIFEFRRYHLKLGYETVPLFLDYYGKGLPSKLSAPGTDPTTSFITLLYSEVGQLNEVIEIWRHGSTDAMERSRVAARSAAEWRNAIGEIAKLANVFTSTIHKPLSFSPLR